MVQMLNEKPKLQQLTIKPFKSCGCEMRPFEERMNQMNKSKTIRATYIVEHDKESGITTWMYIPKEKKEKDMKETNLEHYKEELKKIIKINFDNPRGVIKKIREIFGCQIEVKKGGYATDALLEWMVQPYKESILDDVEKDYLSAVIKPYKNKVIGITKLKDEYETKHYIRIVIKGIDGREAINLPWFKGNTMYKGMKRFKEYTLEELGL